MNTINRACLTAASLLAVLLALPCSADTVRYSLQRYPIASLKLANIVRSPRGGSYFAYVADPDSYLHHLEVGELIGAIGKGGGPVQRISSCAVFYTAVVSDKAGGWNEVPSVLRLEAGSEPFQRNHCKK